MTVEQLSILNDPRARANDAPTAHAAASRVAPAAGALERAIVTAVAGALDPITADEIADRVCADHPGRWGRSTVLSAVSRARINGRVVPAGTGTTSRGSAAIAYLTPEQNR
jgi:hypothetical protein